LRALQQKDFSHSQTATQTPLYDWDLIPECEIIVHLELHLPRRYWFDHSFKKLSFKKLFQYGGLSRSVTTRAAEGTYDNLQLVNELAAERVIEGVRLCRILSFFTPLDGYTAPKHTVSVIE
jgi:hypothetical protein